MADFDVVQQTEDEQERVKYALEDKKVIAVPDLEDMGGGGGGTYGHGHA